MPLHGNVLSGNEICKTNLMIILWLINFYWRQWSLFILKQTHESPLLFLRLWILWILKLWFFCRAGSDQQTQQSTHLAEGQHPL